MVRLAWIVSIFGVFSHLASAQQVCPVIYDEFSGSTSDKLYSKTQDVFCRDTVTDASHAENAAQDAGLTIPVAKQVLGLTFKGSKSSTNWSHWKDSFCHSQYAEVQSQFDQVNISKVFSDNALKAIEACYGQPVYGYFHIPKTGDSFLFSLRVAGKEKLASALIAPSDAVTDCDPQNPFSLSWFHRNTPFDLDISGSPQEFGCTWKDRKKSVSLTVKLDNQGSKTFILPGEPEVKPIDQSPLWCKQKVRVPLVVQAWASKIGMVKGSNDAYVGSAHGTGQSTQKWLIDFEPNSYPNPVKDLGIEYRCQGAHYGWRDWRKQGEWCYDNAKEQTRMETIDIRLTGAAAKNFELSAQCVVEGMGEQNSMVIKDNGGYLECGTVGQSKRLEELKLNLDSKGKCD